MTQNEIKNKNILILGFTERTSFSLAKVLQEMGNRIYISDSVLNDEKQDLFDKLIALKDPETHFETVNLLGRQDDGILDDFKIDMALPSPGVPMSIPIIQSALEKKIEVIGDIELFYRFFPDNKYIAITGTDGKTTTTSLVAEIVKTEKDMQVGGNIGTPIFDLFQQINEETVIVLELSSFQLEEIDSFHPQVAALLNVSADHLDRYDSLKEYREAKRRIFLNQDTNDYAVLNLDCPNYRESQRGLQAKMLTFSLKDKKADCYLDEDIIYLNDAEFIKRNQIKLDGIHNTQNAMAAILIAKSAGISDSSIKKVLATFKGLPHRLEFVRELDGVSYYNDSKATTVNSMEKALLSFESPVILIAGGRDKGLDFSKLKKIAQEKCKSLIAIGEAAEKISQALDIDDTVFAEDMQSAIVSAKDKADTGDVVILSPGCTSFDMYRNYVERGRHFKEIVENLESDTE